MMRALKYQGRCGKGDWILDFTPNLRRVAGWRAHAQSADPTTHTKPTRARAQVFE